MRRPFLPNLRQKERTGRVHPVLVDHIVRLWEDEKKNADEMSLRENLILSAIAVLLGLGVFQLQWFGESNPMIGGEWVLIIKALLLVALSCFFSAFFGLFVGFHVVGRRFFRLYLLAQLRSAEALIRRNRLALRDAARWGRTRRIRQAKYLDELDRWAIRIQRRYRKWRRIGRMAFPTNGGHADDIG